MRRFHRSLVLGASAVLFAAGALVAWRHVARVGPPPGLGAEEQRAYAVAVRAVDDTGGLRVPDRWDVEVVLAGEEYVVTWPVRREVPTPGPDYHARVKIDRTRRVITSLLRGN